MLKQHIHIAVGSQTLQCFENERCVKSYLVSTAKNGVGELTNSECTPRGTHGIHEIIGRDHAENSVFIGRQWTGEIYHTALSAAYPDRDWILTRIIWLKGLEPGRNQGGDVDTQRRYIYIHGTPDETALGIPGSHGCIRMRNQDVIALADWVTGSTSIFIEG